MRLVVDGQASQDRVSAVSLEPLPGFANLDRIPVPDHLPHPTTGEEIPTGAADQDQKYLELHTSAQSLRMQDHQPLNVIRIWNGRNVVANWTVASLYSRAESAYIYGRLSLPEFADPEHLAGADRHDLNDTPLVAAVRHWVSSQIQELAGRIQVETARDHSDADVNTANEKLNALRDLMREFLDSDRDGDEDQGESGNRGTGGGGGKVLGERVDEIVLENEAESIAIALGTNVPIVARAFERTDEGERRWVPDAVLHPVIDDDTIVSVGAGIACGLSEGETTVRFQNHDGSVLSNSVRVEVVSCQGATIDNVPDRLLMQGERVPLRVLLETDAGLRSDMLLEASVDEINMGNCSRSGVYTAGGREGMVAVRVRYGAANEQTESVTMVVGPERVPKRERKPRSGDAGGGGSDIPYIMLCGTPVPGTEDRPPEARTFHPSKHEPTIIDFDPGFENVIFINPDSKEATQVRAGRGGRRGMAGIGNKTFGHFLALKCFEILKRLKVFQEHAGASLDAHQFREAFAMAEQHCAPFIERAYELGQQIAEEHARSQQ
ncbi:MAG: hypothetical protein RIB32_04200 [Phycisphaerales bacterium]